MPASYATAMIVEQRRPDFEEVVYSRLQRRIDAVKSRQRSPYCTKVEIGPHQRRKQRVVIK